MFATSENILKICFKVPQDTGTIFLKMQKTIQRSVKTLPFFLSLKFTFPSTFSDEFHPNVHENTLMRTLFCVSVRTGMLHSNPGDYAWGQGGLDAVITQVNQDRT